MKFHYRNVNTDIIFIFYFCCIDKISSQEMVAVFQTGVMNNEAECIHSQ